MNNIKTTHNRYCPYCAKSTPFPPHNTCLTSPIAIEIDNIESAGVIVLEDTARERFFVIHKDCYEKIRNSDSGVKFWERPDNGKILGKVEVQGQKEVDESDNGEAQDKKRQSEWDQELMAILGQRNQQKAFYGVKIKGYHPCSTKLLFQIDKIAPTRAHPSPDTLQVRFKQNI